MKKCNQLIILLLIASNTFPQSTFDKSVNEASADLANKLIINSKKKIVVLYVTDISKKQTIAGKYIADVISVNLVNHAGNFEVFDRENLSGIAEAKKLIAEGYIDVDRAKALGQMLSVEVIIVGNYTILSKTLKLTLKAFDSKTGLVIAATGKELVIDSDAGALLGINIEMKDVNKNFNSGINNRSLNSNERYNNSETIDKDCENNNTGEYCFSNNTQNELQVTINAVGDQHEMTLAPAETHCFTNLKVQTYHYLIQQLDYKSKMNRLLFGNKNDKKGQISVEQCRSKTFVIK